MKNIEIFINILTLLALVESTQDWKAYKSLHQLGFNDEQIENVMKETWTENVNLIENHNKAFQEKKVNYSKGVNQFTHLSYEEAIATYTGFKRLDSETKIESLKTNFLLEPLAASQVDWSTTYLV